MAKPRRKKEREKEEEPSFIAYYSKAEKSKTLMDLVQRFNECENTFILHPEKIEYVHGNTPKRLLRHVRPGVSRLFLIGSRELSKRGVVASYDVLGIEKVKLKSSDRKLDSITEEYKTKRSSLQYRVHVHCRYVYNNNRFALRTSIRISALLSQMNLGPITHALGDFIENKLMRFRKDIHAFAVPSHDDDNEKKQ